jgi:hypothetical protein
MKFRIMVNLSLADREIWRQEGERFIVVAKEAGEQEIMRSRLADGEIRRQRAERVHMTDVEAGG